MNEPLGILAPTSNIDRVIFTKRPQGNGSAAIQFMAEPGSPTGLRLFITKSGTNVLLSWPGAFSRVQLYSTATLTDPWSGVTDTPTLIGAAWIVTNAITDQTKFYRLQSN